MQNVEYRTVLGLMLYTVLENKSEKHLAMEDIGLVTAALHKS